MWFVLSEATFTCAAAGSQRNKVANNSNRFMIILIFRLVGHASAGLRAVGRGVAEPFTNVKIFFGGFVRELIFSMRAMILIRAGGVRCDAPRSGAIFGCSHLWCDPRSSRR
jgi:hypothetical protein